PRGGGRRGNRGRSRGGGAYGEGDHPPCRRPGPRAGAGRGGTACLARRGDGRGGAAPPGFRPRRQRLTPFTLHAVQRPPSGAASFLRDRPGPARYHAGPDAPPREARMAELEIDFAWGGAGLAALHDRCDAFVILDVLCFTSTVDVAVARGAEVLPFPLGKYGAGELARSGEAVLAKPRREAAGGPSLSPASLLDLAPGTRLVLPSPNGSALSAMVKDRTAFAGSLRNAT